MSQTLILGQKVLMVVPKVGLFISTHTCQLTPSLGFIWYVCFYPSFLLQPKTYTKQTPTLYKANLKTKFCFNLETPFFNVKFLMNEENEKEYSVTSFPFF
jgi:hypothetical protein